MALPLKLASVVARAAQPDGSAVGDPFATLTLARAALVPPPLIVKYFWVPFR
jgi:hypothetical protein